MNRIKKYMGMALSVFMILQAGSPIALAAENTSNTDTKTVYFSDNMTAQMQTVAGTDGDQMLGAAKNAIAIDETNFPDPNFREFVKTLQGGDDSIFTPEEIGKITAIECKGRNISDLKGVEYFTSITELLCSDNPSLSGLDVSKNTELQWLRCSNTALTGIDLSANTELIELECNNSRLEQLNLANNPNLKYLKCNVNQLKSLDVSKNVNLEELECAQNQDLFKLDLTANPKLTKLNCYYCAIHELDLSRNTELKYLNCEINFLTHLDLTQNTKIENFFAKNNKYRSVKCGTSLSELNGFDKSWVTAILDGGNFDNDKVNFTGDMLSYVYQCNDSLSVDFGMRPIHSGTPVKGQEPTCTDDGWKDYYQCVCGRFYKDQSCQTEIPNLEEWKKDEGKIVKKGHKWGEPVITFADDCKTATAAFTCQNDSSHAEKQKAVITSEVKIPATSETMGITTYIATINFNGKTYTATKDVQDIPVIKPGDIVENVIVSNGLTDVPESLMNTEFNTVEKIEKVMLAVVLKDLGAGNHNGDVKTFLYDVTLRITENGVSRPATKEEIEARGGITVVIPYPTGTNKTDYDFSVAHMLTMDMGGMGVGNIETPGITFTDDGLKVTLMGLSPVMVGYQKRESAHEPSEPSKPVDPNKPTEPSESVDPNKPTEQTGPTVSTKINANTGEYAPRTSDEGKTILRVILGIISLGGVVMLTIIRKRGIYGN